MTEKFAPPMVTIRRYGASEVCDVVVVVRGQEMVIRCPNYSDALKWARLECKSYKIREPITDFPDDEEPGDVPLFLRPDTLGEMRSSGVRGPLVYCADCAHAVRISADRWPDHIRLADLEPLFVCQACGRRGADIRPDRGDWELSRRRRDGG
jgi:hypothetical protein